MDTYVGCPIIIGVPLRTDYKADTRVITTLEKWDRSSQAETHYVPSPFPTLGRDKIVWYAKYRIPLPTHILFVDPDVLPRHSTLEKLLSLDKDIVTGVYHVTSKNNVTWSVSRDDTFVPVELGKLPDNPFKIKSCGFGIILIKFKVFEALKWPYWKNVFVPGGIEKGEDIYFCEKARQAGFDIWCDPKVKCNHIRITNLLNVVNILKKENKQ